MARRLLEPDAENGTRSELKEAGRVGSNETALRCTAIQMLLSGISRDQVVEALLVTERVLRKWIKLFNERGVDGLIVKKRPGRTAILGGATGQGVGRASRTTGKSRAHVLDRQSLSRAYQRKLPDPMQL